MVRERLHNVADDFSFVIVLTIEYPIPDEPPVITITEVLFKNSDEICIVGSKIASTVEHLVQKCAGFLFVQSFQSIEVNRLHSSKIPKERIRYGKA